MNMEDQIREAILAELDRQASIGDRKLKITADDQDGVTIEGRVDLDELAMVIVGAVAGGP